MELPLVAEVTVVNATGLHARPCGAIAATAKEYESSLIVACGDRQADGRSILSLMMLEAAQGDVLRFEAHGRDANSLLESLRALVQGGFRERS
ncbi:MAG: HPr family phosphocarrier protein [Planctomycetota bacterium]